MKYSCGTLVRAAANTTSTKLPVVTEVEKLQSAAASPGRLKRLFAIT